MLKSIVPINSSTYAAELGAYGRLEIGDASKKIFSPHVKLGKWEEVSCGLVVPSQKLIAPILQSSQELSWDDPTGLRLIWKVLDSTPQFEDGGLDFQVIFKTNPKIKEIAIPINNQNLEYIFQPPLANLSPDGSTWEDNGRGGISTRPANVNCSYAFYHSLRGAIHRGADAEKFKTGKAFHLYRPQLMDAGGKRLWADMVIKEGNLVISLDKGWMDSALYPVILDPDFGYSSIGASTDLFSHWEEVSKAFGTPASDGVLSSLSVYTSIKAGSPQYCPALYSDVAGTPTTRLSYLATGGTVVGADLAWVTTPASGTLAYSSITSGVQYWLGLKSQSSGNQGNTRYDAGGAGDTRYNSTGSYPETWVTGGSWAGRISIYATYAAGGLSIPVAMRTYRNLRT